MKTNTLIIYEMVPDEILMYLIPNDAISEEQLELCLLANGKYANSEGGDNEGTKFLINALSPKEEYCHEDAPDDWKCCFHKYLVQSRNVNMLTDNPEMGFINRVILTGFMM